MNADPPCESGSTALIVRNRLCNICCCFSVKGELTRLLDQLTVSAAADGVATPSTSYCAGLEAAFRLLTTSGASSSSQGSDSQVFVQDIHFCRVP